VTNEGVKYGRYLLLEPVGTGGMAQVFRAKSIGIEGFEKTVVIKRILPNLAREQEFVEMFISEAKLAVSLTHPNIVQVFDLGREANENGEDTIFIAMELIDGADLAEILKKRIEKHRRAFPAALAAYIIAEVAKALDYAHRRRSPQGQPLGLVHRDISPQNILISFEGDVKLTDFGIAKVRAVRRNTEIGVLKGKYGYMSPEQVRGESFDGRSDIFALGVVFYELLAGRRLFRGNSPIETLSMIEETRIPDLKETIPGLPEPFAPIIKRALTRYPADRYASAAELAGDLLALLFALGKPMQREELGTFARELMGSQPRGDTPSPQMFDPSSLVEALSASKDSAKPELSSASLKSRPTLDGKGILSKLQQLQEPNKTPAVVTVYVLVAPEKSKGLLSSGNARARRIVARYRGRLGPERDGVGLIAFFGDGERDASAAERAARCAMELVALSPPEEEPCAVIACTSLPPKAVYREEAERAAEPGKKLLAQAKPKQVIVDPATYKSLGSSIPAHEIESKEGFSLELAETRYVPPLSSEVLIGRRTEVRSLAQALASAVEGKGQIVTLVGPTGSGKTRLLGELKALLTDRNIGWFSGRCAPSLVAEPYHLICDIFDHLAGCVEVRDPKELKEKLARLKILKLSDREIDLLFKIHTTHAGLGERPGVLPVLEVLLRVVDEVTQLRPLVIALEDLQWLDTPSRDVLTFFLEQVPKKKLLLIATWREMDSKNLKQPPTLQFTDGSLAFSQETKTTFLGPLSEDEISNLGAALLGIKTLGANLKRELIHRSNGNPFFVMELLRACVERDSIEITDQEANLTQTTESPLFPVTLQAIVEERLRNLQPEDEKVVATAAVLGQPVSMEELSMAMGEDVEVGPIIDRCVRLGILTKNQSDELLFTHDLLLSAAKDRLDAEEKLQVHRRVAGEWERNYHQQRSLSSADAAALHFEKANDLSNAALFWGVAGDLCAKERDLQGASERYQKAILAHRGSGSSDSVVPLATKFADLLLTQGKQSQGDQLLDEISTDLPKDSEARVVIDQLRGELALVAGDAERAKQLLDSVAKFGHKLPGVHAARLPLARGRAALFSGDARTAITHLSEAVSFARAELSVPFLSGALSALGRAYVYADEAEQAEQCFSESITRARESKDQFAVCKALLRKTILPFMRRDFSAALEADKEALNVAESEGFVALAAHAAHYVGVDLVYLDDPGRAYSMLERSAASANELGMLVLAWMNEAYLGYLDVLSRPDGPGLKRLNTAKDKLISARAKPKIAQAYYLLGRVNLLRKSRFSAKRYFQDALKLSEEIGHRFLVGELRRLLEEVDAGGSL
jgi:serine/threonine protein kinase/tetratricopeptide (TPR) repeat protein/energy-coupling factor transporter ATP-binding protein EcfA2